MIDFDYWERVIKKTYGDKVSFRGKAKTLIKFGRNDDLGTAGTEKTIMTLFGTETEETYVTDNLIDAVVSDDVLNTQSVVIEGHTLSGGDFTFVTQTLTLNGQTPVALTTPLARATRIFNNGETKLQTGSQVYVYQDSSAVVGGIPQDASLIHVSMAAPFDQSLKCSTTVSSRDYWVLTEGVFAINRNQAARVDFEIQIRQNGNVFRTQFLTAANNSGTSSTALTFDPGIVVPKNSDFRVEAIATSNNTGATAQIFGYLATLI